MQKLICICWQQLFPTGSELRRQSRASLHLLMETPFSPSHIFVVTTPSCYSRTTGASPQCHSPAWRMAVPQCPPTRICSFSPSPDPDFPTRVSFRSSTLNVNQDESQCTTGHFTFFLPTVNQIQIPTSLGSSLVFDFHTGSWLSPLTAILACMTISANS